MLPDLWQLLTCELCELMMSLEGRAPICLDCGHVFCSPCVNRDESFCPICRIQSYRRPVCRSMAAILDAYNRYVLRPEATSPRPAQSFPIILEDVGTPPSQNEDDVDDSADDVINDNIICGRHNLARYNVDHFYAVKLVNAGVHVDLILLQNIFPGNVFAFAYKAIDQRGYRSGHVVIGMFTEQERIQILASDGRFFAGRRIRVFALNSPPLPILQASPDNSAVLVDNIPFLEATGCLLRLVDDIDGGYSLRVGYGLYKHLGAIHLHDFHDVGHVLEKSGIVLCGRRLTLTPISLTQFSQFEIHSSHL